MDAYLSEEAELILKAPSLFRPGRPFWGILIGHKRGHRVFIEKAIPAGKSFFSSLPATYALERHFGGKIIGFFSAEANGTNSPSRKLLAPFAYGKLFIKSSLDTRNRWTARAYIVDYDTSFFLKPIPLHFHGKEGK